MTYRTVSNQTSTERIRQVNSQALESQKDRVARVENSPRTTGFNKDARVTYKAHEYRRGLEQDTDGAIFFKTIPDMSLVINVAMTPYDFSTHFAGPVVDYTITTTPSGLAFDPITGILSGTPTNISSANPIVSAGSSGQSAESNAFRIAVVSA